MEKSVQTCSSCSGTGSSRTIVEGKEKSQPCQRCGGSGKIVLRSSAGALKESKYLVEG